MRTKTYDLIISGSKSRSFQYAYYIVECALQQWYKIRNEGFKMLLSFLSESDGRTDDLRCIWLRANDIYTGTILNHCITTQTSENVLINTNV